LNDYFQDAKISATDKSQKRKPSRMLKDLNSTFIIDYDNRDNNTALALMLNRYQHESMLLSRHYNSQLNIRDHEGVIAALKEKGFVISAELNSKHIIVGFFSIEADSAVIIDFDKSLKYRNNVWYECINVYASPANIKKVEEIITELKVPLEIANYAFELRNYYVSSEKRLEAFSMNIYKEKNNVIDMLYPYMNVDKLIQDFYDSNESILILTGIPGTGKTSLVKRLMYGFYDIERKNHAGGDNQFSLDCHYIKDPLVMLFEDYWQAFLKSEPSLLILDDFDNELSPRTNHDDNTLVNKLLSVSNGIFEHNSKIIITTNRADTEIDEALLRPGRCFDILQLRALTRKEAKNVWINNLEHSEESFENSRGFSGLDMITQSHLMSESDKYKMSQNVEYLYEHDISVRNKYVKGLKRDFGFAP
jgi:GTPase SAR1 family protein